jgi:hypothetical protein
MNRAAGYSKTGCHVIRRTSQRASRHRTVGLAECHHHDGQETIPGTAPEIRTSDHAKFHRLQALVAAAYRSSQDGAPNGATTRRCAEEVLRWVS